MRVCSFVCSLWEESGWKEENHHHFTFKNSDVNVCVGVCMYDCAVNLDLKPLAYVLLMSHEHQCHQQQVIRSGSPKDLSPGSFLSYTFKRLLYTHIYKRERSSRRKKLFPIIWSTWFPILVHTATVCYVHAFSLGCLCKSVWFARLSVCVCVCVRVCLRAFVLVRDEFAFELVFGLT